MKTFVLICVFSLFNSLQICCQEMGNCTFQSGLMNAKQHEIALQTYLDCLVSNNLQNKNKSQLLTALRDAGISSKFANTMMMYSKNYINYQSLLQICSIDDFQEMINSEVSEWRYYGFWAVAEKQETDVFDTLKKLLKDKKLMYAKMGCLSEENTIAHYCIQLVTEKYRFEEEDYKSEIYQLTLEEKRELNVLLEK